MEGLSKLDVTIRTSIELLCKQSDGCLDLKTLSVKLFRGAPSRSNKTFTVNRSSMAFKKRGKEPFSRVTTTSYIAIKFSVNACHYNLYFMNRLDSLMRYNILLTAPCSIKSSDLSIKDDFIIKL